MKQLLQNLKSGESVVAEVPAPGVSAGHVLIATRRTLVSAGTERMMVEFGKANLLEKARQQPDKVRMVLDKVRTDGLTATMDAVLSKLDQPMALGYCNVGTVIGVGPGVTGFEPGDRVASNGKHAEVVAVPQNLCARIPDAVSNDWAAFTVLGAIGLQGMRLADVKLGECVVVTGLGLIGLLTVQMLRAQGCRVLGIDYDPARLAMARSFGAEVAMSPGGDDDVLAMASAFSRGRGVDAVLITASTESSEPVSLAAKMCRKRGRIVLVGVTGLELSRADFYEKELSFQVSCSYGPGRYDPDYEDRGHDYPVGFVRWTAQRNFEAVLDLMATGQLDPTPLISHRFKLDRAADAYDLLSSRTPSLGIVIEYPGESHGVGELRRRRVSLAGSTAGRADAVSATGQAQPVRIAVLGAGNYGSRVLIPAFKRAGASLRTVVSAGGVSATHFGRKFGFQEASTDWRAAIADPDTDAVVIATRHDLHAAQVMAAIEAGKSVFCEKPLCLSRDELHGIETAFRASARQPLLTVGFNRRFAPLVVRAKQLLSGLSEPMSLVMTVNAGVIPAAHWTQDRNVGGGRILGEGCHFVDLLRYLVGVPVRKWSATALGRHPAMSVTSDKATLVLEFSDGSVGTIHYLSNGHKGFPKERLEVFCAGRVLQLDNFRSLRGWGWHGFARARSWRQDKGQRACAQAFVDAVRNESPSPIPLDELLEVSRLSIELQSALD
jgi:predicted dehydrogenase/threonine dehydrogenase-like Zn-dependent dehydrogenase